MNVEKFLLSQLSVSHIIISKTPTTRGHKIRVKLETESQTQAFIKKINT